ncbi:MAG: NAD(P)/FAD-dependent oxidoreductase [Myxococcales bacterium]|nr:NAD(P)/FAD-dependent oxidoreductase [Myxococcales bacterium]
MSQSQLDVAILGGGMAGNLLARQLVRRLPRARIAVFDKKHAHAHNVGESMVEIASNYFVRRLGLGSYLYQRQTPKNGLRFFFDTPERDTPLPEMSEIGSDSLPFHPAFQIDRSRLEGDLIEMNARDGVRVHLGARVTDLELARDGSAHRFSVSDGSHTQECASRWLVDASGRSRLIARREGLDVPETQLANASVWGWFTGVTDIDAVGPDAFRARVRHTPRRLSTLHFMYRGYWIWFIPLQDGMTSIGVVCEKRHLDPRTRTPDGFLDFLRGHEAVRSLLENAKPIATQGYRHLAYGTQRFFSPERWALVGEAAAFPDPFYSPGADFIALANDFSTDLIARDLAGEPLRARAERYDQFMRFRFEAAMRLYRDHYPLFGSYELTKLKWDLDVGCYYNLWISQYLCDEHLNGRALRRQLLQREPVLAALSNFTALFRLLENRLRETGAYHRSNRGAYSDGQDCIRFMKEVGRPRSEGEVLARTEQIFNAVRDRALDLLEGTPGHGRREPKPLAWFLEPRALDR